MNTFCRFIILKAEKLIFFFRDPDKWIPVERVDGPILAIKGLDDV